MTREKAIFILKRDNPNNIAIRTGFESLYDQRKEAFSMAIKALEQEPFIDKINKMKSEIADSLEFWDYSPNNNPLARDMLETITNFWGEVA